MVEGCSGTSSGGGGGGGGQRLQDVQERSRGGRGTRDI